MEDRVVETFIKTTFKNGMVYTEISHPPDQIELSITVQCHILISAVSMLLKSCKKFGCGTKDYDLFSDIKKHLDDDFISTKCYSDVEIDKNRLNND